RPSGRAFPRWPRARDRCARARGRCAGSPAERPRAGKRAPPRPEPSAVRCLRHQAADSWPQRDGTKVVPSADSRDPNSAASDDGLVTARRTGARPRWRALTILRWRRFADSSNNLSDKLSDWLQAARTLSRRHWLFVIVACAGLALRIVTQVAYSPALVYIDSYRYLTGDGTLDP